MSATKLFRGALFIGLSLACMSSASAKKFSTKPPGGVNVQGIAVLETGALSWFDAMGNPVSPLAPGRHAVEIVELRLTDPVTGAARIGRPTSGLPGIIDVSFASDGTTQLTTATQELALFDENGTPVIAYPAGEHLGLVELTIETDTPSGSRTLHIVE
jgi:hypothetical protein